MSQDYFEVLQLFAYNVLAGEGLSEYDLKRLDEIETIFKIRAGEYGAAFDVIQKIRALSEK